MEPTSDEMQLLALIREMGLTCEEALAILDMLERGPITADLLIRLNRELRDMENGFLSIIMEDGKITEIRKTIITTQENDELAHVYIL